MKKITILLVVLGMCLTSCIEKNSINLNNTKWVVEGIVYMGEYSNFDWMNDDSGFTFTYDFLPNGSVIVGSCDFVYVENPNKEYDLLDEDSISIYVPTTLTHRWEIRGDSIYIGEYVYQSTTKVILDGNTLILETDSINFKVLTIKN